MKHAAHVLFWLLFGVVLLIGSANSQNVSQWVIPGEPNIQGLDALYPENPNDYVYFTEYDKMKIGMLNNIAPPLAMLSEWRPIGTETFNPFKIVAGKWTFYSKTDPTPLTAYPFTSPPIDILKPADITKYLIAWFRMNAMVTFTLPDQKKIGILVNSPWGAGTYAFWLYPTPTELGTPWDIQRRCISAEEVSAWVSGKDQLGNPEQALWQFFPLTNNIKKWDLSICKLTVEVFYVVPAANVKGVTEIWIGGQHQDAAGVPHDCIAYMMVNKKNTAAVLRIWDLPDVTQPRAMNAIVFTHRPTREGYTKMQVWLSSATVPEMTILEPNSIFKKDLKDKVCVVPVNAYNSPNGLFWNDPVFTSLTGADDNRRIWSTSSQNTELMDMLIANKGAARDDITFVPCEATPTDNTTKPEVVKALRIDTELTDESTVEYKQDTIDCSIDRYIWSPATGFTADYTGAMLDIDMQGKAAAIAGAPGFNYTIIWHEPMKSRIGMLWSTPPIARTIFDLPFGESPDAQPTVMGLQQNYPNPFNPTTSIDFTLPEDARVTLKVYNSLGQEVATLINNEVMFSGDQSVEFNAANLPSGVYLYRIHAEKVNSGDEEETATPKVLVETKKMIYVK